MQVFFFLAYLVISTVQLFAIAAGIENGMHVGSFLSFVFAFLTTYIPFLGSVLGIYGAITEWGWNAFQAGILFFWYIPIMLMVGIIGLVADGGQR